MRNNLGFCQPSEIYLIQNFQKHCHRSNGKQYRFGKERYIKQINDTWEGQKEKLNSVVQYKKVMSEKNQQS